MTRTTAAALALCLSSAAFAASHPQDAEGTKDHPDIPRFPGFVIHNQEQNDFNAIEVVVAIDKESGEETTKPVEGKYLYTQYYVAEGGKIPSTVQVMRNFENAFKKLRAKVHMFTHEQTDGRATWTVPLGKSQRWVHLRVFNSGEGYELIVLDEAAMKQELEFSASAMKDELDKNGFIALYGIQFDTGKDTIKAESEPLLAEIVTLLNDNSDLQLTVEGHTDNVGNAKANKKLSEKRAAAVKKWLVGKGVSAKRLATAGFGDSKPVGDNRTEDGRAKNRRVELVKKKG